MHTYIIHTHTHTESPGALFTTESTVSPGCDTNEPATPAATPENSVMAVPHGFVSMSL